MIKEVTFVNSFQEAILNIRAKQARKCKKGNYKSVSCMSLNAIFLNKI